MYRHLLTRALGLLVLGSIAACGQVPADSTPPPADASMSPAPGGGVASISQSLFDPPPGGTITLNFMPRGSYVGGDVTFMYPTTGLTAPGYQVVALTAAGGTVTIPQADVVCNRGITTVATLDGKPIPTGFVPSGIEGKVRLYAHPTDRNKDVWAGAPGEPTDSQAIKISVAGGSAELGELKAIGYVGQPYVNFFIPSGQLGCVRKP
jgi:hypothetical protein